MPSVRKRRLAVVPDVQAGTPEELVTKAEVLAVVIDDRVLAVLV